MDNPAFKSHEPPEKSEETPHIAPPPYSALNSSFGLDQLKAITRVDVRKTDITMENGDTVFGVRAECIDETGPASSFDLYDRMGTMVIRFKTVNKCCTPRIEVHINGQYVSKVGLNAFCNGSPNYAVFKPTGGKAIKVLYTPGSGMNRYWLRLQDRQGKVVGTIRKEWHGLADETFSISDELMVDFNEDLEVQYKAAVIGLCTVLIQPKANFWPISLTYLI